MPHSSRTPCVCRPAKFNFRSLVVGFISDTGAALCYINPQRGAMGGNVYDVRRFGSMRIDGGCHCGYITYEAEADPQRVHICHCTDCQKLSGSAFRTGIRVASDSFRMISGEPTIYVKTAESGRKSACVLSAVRVTHLCVETGECVKILPHPPWNCTAA